MKTTDSITRTGKIARLPKAVRDRLNQQISDGVPGKELVRWLNGMNEVRDVLFRYFSGRDITEQNLSEWKRGGYLDWLKHEERREWVRRLKDEADDLEKDAGQLPLTERIAPMLDVILAGLFEAKMRKPPQTREEMSEMLMLSRELAKHRRLSLDASSLSERRKEKQKQEPANDQERLRQAKNKALLSILKDENCIRNERQLLEGRSPAARKLLEDELNRRIQAYFDGPPDPGYAADLLTPDQPESDSIQPDPT